MTEPQSGWTVVRHLHLCQPGAPEVELSVDTTIPFTGHIVFSMQKRAWPGALTGRAVGTYLSVEEAKQLIAGLQHAVDAAERGEA